MNLQITIHIFKYRSYGGYVLVRIWWVLEVGIINVFDVALLSTNLPPLPPTICSNTCNLFKLGQPEATDEQKQNNNNNNRAQDKPASQQQQSRGNLKPLCLSPLLSICRTENAKTVSHITIKIHYRAAALILMHSHRIALHARLPCHVLCIVNGIV